MFLQQKGRSKICRRIANDLDGYLGTSGNKFEINLLTTVKVA